MLKIGIVFDDSLDKPDGVQQYILTIGAWLERQGHAVHFLVGQTKRQDVTVHSLSRNINVRFNGNRMSIPLPANRQRIKKLLDTEQYDVLHVQVPYSPQLAARIVRLAPEHTAVIGTFHILPYGPIEKLATKGLSILLHNNKKRFDEWICISPASQEFAKRWFGIKGVLIPNAIDVSAFHTVTVKHNDLRIVFLGRLVARKGCAELLEAFSLLPSSLRQSVSLVIGGRGPLLSKLERRARKLSVEKQCTFQGFISEADKPAFLAQANIAVFPATAGESFGMVLLEAMAAGSEVVMAGDNPGYSSILGKMPGVMIHPDNTRQFAERLELLLRDEERRRELHDLQHELIKQYDVNTVGRQLVDIYNQAIAKRAVKLHNS